MERTVFLLKHIGCIQSHKTWLKTLYHADKPNLGSKALGNFPRPGNNVEGDKPESHVRYSHKQKGLSYWICSEVRKEAL